MNFGSGLMCSNDVVFVEEVDWCCRVQLGKSTARHENAMLVAGLFLSSPGSGFGWPTLQLGMEEFCKDQQLIMKSYQKRQRKKEKKVRMKTYRKSEDFSTLSKQYQNLICKICRLIKEVQMC
mmetsp:Transcript_31896/g.42125  ORF Transcript_31896/g.42125 Transcript_31896/m.42125 type:complete len:122 (-) Transcript_31896:150-515(-)